MPSARAWAAHHFVLGLAFIVVALGVVLGRLREERPALFHGTAVVVAAYG